MKKNIFYIGVFLLVFIVSPLFAFAQPHPDDRPNPGGSGTEGTPSDRPNPGGNPSDTGDGIVPTGSGYLDNPLAFNSITGFLGAIIDIILILAVPIIVFFIIYAGFLYVTAQGNEDKIRKATTAFTWTIVGGLLVLGAWVLVEVIQGTVDALTF